MYAQVKSPGKKVTEKWLDQAFAPLKDYLEREYPEEKDQIMGYLMFMGNEDNKFHYKNSITRSYIIFDQEGAIVQTCDSALQYQFEEMFGPRGEYMSLESRRLHPNVTRWIEQSLGKHAAKFGLEVGVFLQELWGPIVNFDFSDLKIGFPLYRTRVPYCLYIYPSEFHSLIVFHFVGDEIVERRCNSSQYSDYLQRERELMLEDWRNVVIIREMLERIDGLRRDLPMLLQNASLRDPAYELNPALFSK